MKYLNLIIVALFLFSCQTKEGDYICPPCDLPCDKLTFEQPGVCPHCKMTLVKKSDLIAESSLIPNQVELTTGSGVFLFADLENEEDKSVKVYYHKPQNFSDSSQILLVIPGAGRDGDEYRDAWVDVSEKHAVLILSPMFEEDKYPFEDYHLCGLIGNLNVNESFEYEEGTNQVHLNHEKISFDINADKSKWIFGLIDKMFKLVIDSENLPQESYDVFGHSAGGQILHRMAILHDSPSMNKIIAANPGFYTLPDMETELPFGLTGLNISDEELSNRFSSDLTIMVGELDNENETKGTLLRSSIADKQGVHRLARAKYFHSYSKAKASSLNVDFNWKLEVVPSVGHNHQLMAAAAAKLLYE